MRGFTSEGFVIGRKKFGEADRFVTLFTKNYGKITLIAKGVRKLTSKKRGGIENFSHIKFSAIKSHGIDILSEVEVINTYQEIREDLRKTTVAYYFCEVINKMTREGEEHPELYGFLQKYFDEIKYTKNLKNLRLNFVKDLLISLGFWSYEKQMSNPDAILESITERQISSFKIGRRMLQQK